MLHQTPRETSANTFEATDGIVSLRILDEPARYPKSDYKVLVFRLSPKDHTRVRRLSNGIIEYLPTNAETHAYLVAFNRLLVAQGKPPLSLDTPLINKPEERKQYWYKRNTREFSQPSRNYRKKGRFIRNPRYVTNYRNN